MKGSHLASIGSMALLAGVFLVAFACQRSSQRADTVADEAHPRHTAAQSERSKAVSAADVMGPEGVVYPDFSRAGIPGGIPEMPTVVKVTDHGAIANDDQDDAEAIQAAVRAAAKLGGGGVLIPEGRFIVDRTIIVDQSNVVVRGMGADKTVLEPRFKGRSPLKTSNGQGPIGDRVFVFDPGKSGLRYDLPLEKPLHRGQVIIPVPQPDRFRVGEVVMLFATPPAEVAAQLSETGLRHLETGSYGSIYSAQHLRIAEVLAGAIRVTKPVRLDLSLDQDPKLMRQSLLGNCGLESLRIEQTLPNEGINGVFFTNTERCWMRDVDIRHIGNWPVSWSRSYEFEMRDCHLHESRSLGGSLAYVGFGFATDGLVENCRITNFRHVSISMASNGNVFRNCFFENVDLNYHMHWPYENLVEQCHVDATRGPNATDSTVAHGSYGYGFYLPDHAGGGHNPAGPRNTFYANRFITSRDGMILGGGGAKRTIVAYNLFDVQHGVAAVVKPGNQHTLVIGNAFVIRDPNRRPGGSIYGIDNAHRLIGAVLFPEGASGGLRFEKNRFYGAPQGQLFAGGRPPVATGNEALANWQRAPSSAPAKAVTLAGSWRVRSTQQRPAAPAPEARHPDPGMSDEARRLLMSDVDDKIWETASMPRVFAGGALDWARYDGEAVIRRSFDVPESLLAEELIVSLGAIDDHDEVWINGSKVGETHGDKAWKKPRRYRVPVGLLKATGNVIGIRIWDAFGAGGLSGIAEDMWIGIPLGTSDSHLPESIEAPTPPVPSLYLLGEGFTSETSVGSSAAPDP